MTLQTPAPIKHHTLPISASTARGLADRLHEGDLIVDPPYQRGSVWTTHQRIALIRSLLAGTPIPAIIINERFYAARRGSTEFTIDSPAAVIDGRQRLEALHAWFHGDLAVPASWFAPEDVLDTVDTEDGPYVRYRDLTKPVQRDFATGRTVPLVTVTLDTVAEEAALYVLVEQSGTPQTADTIATAQAVADGVAP